MPNSQNAQQGTAADSGAVYSPRLCNEDLAPTRDQNWSWYNIFSFWMSDVHSMGGYVVAASFFTLGLASWQVLLCLLVGICIVQLCANLVAKPSQMAGVPLRGDQPSGVWRLRGQYSGGDPRADCLPRGTAFRPIWPPTP
ncbi:allantoin permease [Enterobacter asburiae]|uniref:Allantoin permease n=1 Tax=Enterobacter asburiae TaxID=61645 RepID=A0A376F4E7_ENTAS|nr:allantoin permease [Enterobacter asburiae]